MGMKVLAAQAEAGSISTQGRQIVMKPKTVSSFPEVRGAGGVMNKYLDSAVKIGPTQIKLDTRVLGDRWKIVLEDILRSNCA